MEARVSGRGFSRIGWRCSVAALTVLSCCWCAANAVGSSLLPPTGGTQTYRIDIGFVQSSRIEQGGSNGTATRQVNVDGGLTLYLSVRVLEDLGDYAKVAATYDSAHLNLRSRVDSVTTELSLFTSRDRVKIWKGDSLVAELAPGTPAPPEARDFYARLLFVGEEIPMYVYPTGEIANILDNKNLWEMSSDLMGFRNDGLLEVVVPADGSNRWEQTVPIKTLGDFGLKTRPDPLKVIFRLSADQISFNGKSSLPDFFTRATSPDLDADLTLTLTDFVISKRGSGQLSPAGVLTNLSYDLDETGEMLLKSEADNLEISQFIDYSARIEYRLLGR